MTQETIGQQCTAHRASTGERCRAWAIHGGNVCVTHGGKAPQVRAKAEERIAAMVSPALDRLRDLIDNADGDSVKLSAVKDVLDRAGFKPTEKRETKVDGSLSIDGLREALTA